ncbi:conserved hypothetical protein [Frankia canadensis]|uniref:Uncharacterized protein n=1 Tax=Frankia canadensis TaxID=1836972 RepID=A0A2I2L0A3_9ACTN|nr:hypothetical protein [Frankia canadensis]SNQ51338.1 conserved hypothetical protein [Frankia canadensis]SOU58628.1 conserved hypothetical protein [Frankia canadensis]
MADKQELFDAVVEILRRGYQISDLDSTAGTFDLRDEDRAVRVTLELNLLKEYFNWLDEENAVLGLAEAQGDERDRVRLQYIIMQIQEYFDSDVFLSLVEIRLDRSADGRVSLVRRRGPERRSFLSADAEGGYWSSDRPGT